VSAGLGYGNAGGVSNTNACRATATASDPDLGGIYGIGHCTSLQRYKDNTVNLNMDIATLRQLRPVEFDWNIDAHQHDIGFIAEEVEAVNPLLAEYSNGVLSGVAYNKLPVLLTRSVQQLDVQVQDIDARLTAVESGNFSGSLSVVNDVYIGDDLVVQDDAEVQGDFKVLGNTEVVQLTVKGKIITQGLTPTIVLGASLVVGQNSVATVSGNDTAGTVSYTSGTSNMPTYDIGTGATVEVVFNAPYTAVPRILLTPNSEASSAVDYYVTKSTTSFTVHFTSLPSASTTYSFDYIVLQ
jgi:hypothetical protein